VTQLLPDYSMCALLQDKTCVFALQSFSDTLAGLEQSASAGDTHGGAHADRGDAGRVQRRIPRVGPPRDLLQHAADALARRVCVVPRVLAQQLHHAAAAAGAAVKTCMQPGGLLALGDAVAGCYREL
jgi:hypothetical protein